MLFGKLVWVLLLLFISINIVQSDGDDDDDRGPWEAVKNIQNVTNRIASLIPSKDKKYTLHSWNYANKDNPNFGTPPPLPPFKGGIHPAELPQGSHLRGPRDPEYEDFYEEKIKTLKHQSNLGLGLGIGLGVGIPVIIIICIAAFVYYRYRRGRNQGSRLSSIATAIMNPYSPHIDSKGQSPAQCSDLWAMDRQNVVIDFENKLGSGAFCNVHKGTIKGAAAVRLVCPNLIALQKFTDCEVAVKLLPPFADDIARSDFSQEINFMKSLHYHPHLVSMLGYVPDARNPLLLVEYCAKGDLLHFVRNHRAEIEHGYENSEGIKIKNLVSFAWQISNGLEYLNSVGCIHRDVAARNVLLDADNTCKIADFGLCRLTDNLLYTARGGRLPIRWMALESLKSFEYSFKTDVWAYGVLLFELTSLGEVPYSTIDNQQLLEFLENGQRLHRPMLCPPEIFEIMKGCWQTTPTSRPSFSQICDKLRQILEAATPDYGYLVPISYSDGADSLKALRIDDV